MYREAGRRDEALALLREVLGLMKAQRGPDHPDTLIAMHNLAVSYSRPRPAGRGHPAVRGGGEAPEGQAVARSPRSRSPASTAWSMPTWPRGAGPRPRPRRARASTARTRKPPDDWSRFHTMSLLGAALAGQKKYAEAEPLLIAGYEGLKAREAKIPAPSRGRLAAAAARIVPFYEAWGQPDKAAEWRRSLGPPDPRPSKP